MPVAVSSAKVCGTYVTDIRYREDATDWDEPEDLPFSNIRSFREQKLGNQRERISFPLFHFVLLLLFLKLNKQQLCLYEETVSSSDGS